MSELPEILFIGIAAYVLYRFVFNFFLPIVRTTRQVRQQFRNVQENMRNQQGGQQRGQGPYDPHEAPKKPSPGANSIGEYIDFEEIK